MIWSKNSFFFFFFLTVISQSACLSFQGLCHWNMYICMTAHGWPQMASDHTTSQKEIMTSQKKITVCVKRKLWIMTSGFIPFFTKTFPWSSLRTRSLKNLMVFSFTLHMVVQHHAVYEIQCDFPCVKPGDRENLLWKNSILMKYLQRKT